MHNQPSTVADPAIDDRRDRAAVLDYVLSVYPGSLTLAELISEMNSGEAGFAERDRIGRAVKDLAGVGLVRMNCELVMPTRAAVAFHVLQEEG